MNHSLSEGGRGEEIGRRGAGKGTQLNFLHDLQRHTELATGFQCSSKVTPLRKTEQPSCGSIYPSQQEDISLESLRLLSVRLPRLVRSTSRSPCVSISAFQLRRGGRDREWPEQRY